MRSEQDAVTASGLASVRLSIVFAVIFLRWVSVKVTLREIFKVFNSFFVEIALTVVKIILDVFLGKRNEENDFCFVIIKFFFHDNSPTI